MTINTAANEGDGPSSSPPTSGVQRPQLDACGRLPASASGGQSTHDHANVSRFHEPPPHGHLRSYMGERPAVPLNRWLPFERLLMPSLSVRLQKLNTACIG